jgi:hypothetical protein
MKLPFSFAVFTAFFTAAVAAAAPASDHSHDEKSEWADVFGGASLPVVWQSMTASSERITAAIAAKKPDGIADWAETIHVAAHALIDQVKLPDAERKKRLDAALEQAAKLADEVSDAASHNEPDRMAEAFRRLRSALALAQSRLPKEVTEAATETPRFAKAAPHDPNH